MKLTKSILKILIVFLFLSQNSFATTKPIIGIGIVVKKNPGKGYISVPTGNGGGFSTQLSEGVYELSFPQEQLQTSINGIVKADYPKSNYQYDGSGVELVLDNLQITVNSKATKENVFAVDKQNSITITVPKGGATLSGKLSWNDAVMTNSISCPDGFIMQNGECVPMNSSGNQQARTEGKLKGKIIKGGDHGMRSVSGSTAGDSKNSCGPSLTVSLNANGGTSSSAGVDNSFNFNPSLGIAIHWKNFGIGLDAGTFKTKPNLDFNTYAAPLQNLDFLTITNTKSDWVSTYFMLGPQYTIFLNPSQNKESQRHTPFHNKLAFTLALKGGLTINKAPEFSVADNSTPPKSIASYTTPQDYKTNAFSLKPSIGFSYWITKNFAMTANAQYLMQAGQKEFTTGYRDLTNVNLAPPISPDQFNQSISLAPKVMTNTKGPDKYMSFGFGITYRFNKGGGDCDDSSDDIIGNTSEKGITENGLKKNDIETSSDETQRKGIKEQGLKKNDVETTLSENQRKGITENGLPKNVVGNVITDVELKQIAETLVNYRKGWDGTVKGNKVENVVNADVKAIAETLVNLARKGWDGTVKGNKIENTENEADVKTVAEALVNIRKGWDGTVKWNKVENVANEADVKAIAETLVNIRKGWDGTIKGKNIAEKGIQENGLKRNEIETSAVNGSKAIIENPNDDTGEPEQQVYKFSNGCTRTCTGNWYANSDGSVGCDGTAGPKVCINKAVTSTPSATARVSLINQVFDQEGNVKTK
ncbi:MAG: hypothetical protein PHC28_14130 [Flavobacterium sp.]|uniref:hypothetical protein n=1 Tax=Flavobacterium sp. TaxID=239 RepID=UPI0026152ADB|nr:hypothetical protein [Flavobacterium sp.]MDD5151591.1 hypothetical protein [Flavobacterium sp.]